MAAAAWKSGVALLWFSASWQLSIPQLLAHSIPVVGWRRELEE